MNLTGIRPTGKLHLGHYFSVIKPAKNDPDCMILIADLHVPDKVEFDVLYLNRFLNLPLDRFILQSKDEDYAGFFAEMLTLAPIGKLERMTQYKSAKPEAKNAHLLVYPVMMAVDCLGFEQIYVGEDQKQHLEFVRDLIRAYNAKYGENFYIPIAKTIGGRVMDLRHPETKMSKSLPDSCLFLEDSPETIEQKLRAAATTPAGIANLKFIAKEFGTTFNEKFCQDSKTQLSRKLIEVFSQWN